MNGITFVSTSDLLPDNLTSGVDVAIGTNGGDAAYDNLLSSVDFGGGGNPFTITVGDGDGNSSVASAGLLQPGTNYQIQVWFYDDRANQDTRVMQFGDGNGNTVLLNDQFAIGTFTADSATQDLSLAAQGFGNAHINAYSILAEVEVDLPSVLVNTDSGEVTLRNTTTTPFDMDLYRISGPVGSLDVAGWNSLESPQVNQGQDLLVFPRGDNNGNGWEELGIPDSESLSEAFLTGSSILGASDSISLGNAFDTTGPGENALTFEVRSPSGALFELDIEYVGSGQLLCDFDADLDCDPDDIITLYTTNPTTAEISVWLSQASDPSNPYKTNSGGTVDDVYVIGDVNLDGDVNSVDLGQLLNNFNSTSGVGWAGGDLNADSEVDSVDLGQLLNNFNFTSAAAAAAVPEPATATLALLALTSLLSLGRRRRILT